MLLIFSIISFSFLLLLLWVDIKHTEIKRIASRARRSFIQKEISYLEREQAFHEHMLNKLRSGYLINKILLGEPKDKVYRRWEVERQYYEQ